jgi:hypothetical protein
MKVCSVPETTELPDLGPPCPVREPAAAPRSGTLVTVADASGQNQTLETVDFGTSR